MQNCIRIPSEFPGFVQSDQQQSWDFFESRRGYHYLKICGSMPQMEMFPGECPHCHTAMHRHGTSTVRLAHIPLVKHWIFDRYDEDCMAIVHEIRPVRRTEIVVERERYRCPECGHVETGNIPFKAEEHMITKSLHDHVCLLLSSGFNLSETAKITGLDPMTIKAIDKKRLKELYTVDGKELKKPKQATQLGIDEFKLHDGHCYATHIMDLITGEVLYVSKGKGSAVVENFIRLVGDEWMKNVKVVACDMNAGFYKTFQNAYPHIDVVFDRFHIVNHFLEDVIGNVRKDEYKRLVDEGRFEEAKKLKGARFILASNRETLRQKDERARNGEVRGKESELFNLKPSPVKGGNESRLDEIIKDNHLLITVELIKDLLKTSFESKTTCEMRNQITKAITLCRETENVHFCRYANFLEKHIKGIISHARYNISSGRVEGFNNKIKTMRRKAYGFNDDEYFFLKIIDISK